MAAVRLNIVIEQGATFELPIVWKSGGVPVDLTGYTARMQVRAEIAASAPLLTLTTENARIVLGTDDGAILLTVEADATAALTADRGFYDLELVAPITGHVRRLIQGRVRIAPEVTR
jgi:hypothetical protein